MSHFTLGPYIFANLFSNFLFLSFRFQFVYTTLLLNFTDLSFRNTDFILFFNLLLLLLLLLLWLLLLWLLLLLLWLLLLNLLLLLFIFDLLLLLFCLLSTLLLLLKVLLLLRFFTSTLFNNFMVNIAQFNVNLSYTFCMHFRFKSGTVFFNNFCLSLSNKVNSLLLLLIL